MFKEQQDFAFGNVKNATTPCLIITAKQDNVVKNSAASEILKLVNNPKNKLIEYEDADHLTITADLEHAISMAK
jgi:esterase/lipase